MGVSAMIDRHGGFNHVQPVEGKHLLWEVAMARGTQIVRVNNNTASCNHAHIDELPGGGSRAVMEWNDLPFWKENKALSIRAIVELPAGSGVAHWRISVSNSSDYWGVWTVSYPLVNGFPAAGKYDIARPKQSSGGELLKGWSQRIEEHYPSRLLAHAVRVPEPGPQRGLFRRYGPGCAFEGFRDRAGRQARHGALRGEHGGAGVGVPGLLPCGVGRLPRRMAGRRSALPRLGAAAEMGPAWKALAADGCSRDRRECWSVAQGGLDLQRGGRLTPRNEPAVDQASGGTGRARCPSLV